MNDSNNEKLTGPIVGIDLGTTNSVVAAIINGKPTVLVEDGESILPSIVGLDNDGKLITGTVARNQLAAFPERTVASIKRKMGTTEKVTLGDQSFTPQEISAMILRRLCDRAARQLGQPIKRAVITVPAFFDENQRQATREAGELAGLTVERIINEPTAATLVYHAGTHDQRHIVVYDFGGGTFDVSIVRMEAGVVEVLTSKGDTHLGGDDLDAVLLDYVADEFKEEHGIDLRRTMTTRYRLLQACEKAKCELSKLSEATITEEFIAELDGQPLSLSTTITRNQYEELIKSFVDRTIECLDEALAEVGLTTPQIDDLVLVGGSTRTPLVESRLREEFNREPSRSVDPDLAVALGAATQAAMHDGESIGPVLVDVATHTLGIAVSQRMMFGESIAYSPILYRNQPLPASFEEIYSTMSDNQKIASIEIYQGEHERLERNTQIGDFELELETGAENSRIVVRFDLTLDGTLKVTATQSSTKRTKDLLIDNALTQFKKVDRDKAEARLSEMFDSSEELLSDQELPAQSQWLDDADSATGNVDWRAAGDKFPAALALVEQAEKRGATLTGDDADDINSLTEKLKQALAESDAEQITAISAELDDVLFYVQ